MKLGGKLGLGCAAFAPLVSAVFLGCYIGYGLITHDLYTRGLGSAPDPIRMIADGPFDATDLAAFGVLAVAVALLELALTVVLTLHAVKDPRLSGAAIALWVVGFLFAGPFALPLYVVLFVLRDPPPKRVAALESPPIAV